MGGAGALVQQGMNPPLSPPPPSPLPRVTVYPIQKITEIYNKVTEMYKPEKVTELEISSWNVLFLLRSEVAYIGTGPILP